MSGHISGLVWGLDIRMPLRQTLLAFADHANDDGTSVYPSNDRIAAKTGQRRWSVNKQIRAAVEMGILVPVRKRRKNVVEYQFALQVLYCSQILWEARHPKFRRPSPKKGVVAKDTQARCTAGAVVGVPLSAGVPFRAEAVHVSLGAIRCAPQRENNPISGMRGTQPDVDP